MAPGRITRVSPTPGHDGLPRRALEGWTGRDEVRGRIPFDELPHLFNPDSGYVSHANAGGIPG
ncbi:MAG: penicillin acylase family protein [Verrucomicrobia bacterium]|nr:penicillin acylase family protein [Verrucomicrobiota bacterium]